MCENCDKDREEVWSEIRDLMNYRRKAKGPLSESLAADFQKLRDTDELSKGEIFVLEEEIRAELIALRCAFVIRNLPGSEFHGMHPSMIMGLWAGNSYQAERMARLQNLMGGLFAGLIPNDDTDAEEN